MSRHSNRKRSQRDGHANKLTAAPKRRPRLLWSSALKHVAQIAKDTTEAANTNRPNEQKTDRKLDVTVIVHAAAEKALVAEEAEKGYGLRVIRSDKTTGPRRACDPILKDIVALGETYDINARTAVRPERTNDDAILKEAARRQHNLIVMGV
jgi:hypothetical protein